MKQSIKDFIDSVAELNPNEPEFMQAVTEVAETVIPFIEANEKYQDQKLLERMVEPERTLMFRVPWTDDKGEIQVNKSPGKKSQPKNIFRIFVNAVNLIMLPLIKSI